MTTNTPIIEIRDNAGDLVIYRSEKAKSIADAVVEAVASGANLVGAYLGDANLHDAYLVDANLSGAYLGGADLRDANLGGANLSRANLSYTNMTGAYMRGANLIGANLGDANLHDACLVDAYLSNANLSGANLSRASLHDANLNDSKITATATVTFTGHGQCGRQLLAVRAGDLVLLWCGCFHGTPDELRAFIARDEPSYRKTRTIALDTVLMLLDTNNN